MLLLTALVNTFVCHQRSGYVELCASVAVFSVGVNTTMTL